MEAVRVGRGGPSGMVVPGGSRPLPRPLPGGGSWGSGWVAAPSLASVVSLHPPRL